MKVESWADNLIGNNRDLQGLNGRNVSRLSYSGGEGLKFSVVLMVLAGLRYSF